MYKQLKTCRRWDNWTLHRSEASHSYDTRLNETNKDSTYLSNFLKYLFLTYFALFLPLLFHRLHVFLVLDEQHLSLRNLSQEAWLCLSFGFLDSKNNVDVNIRKRLSPFRKSNNGTKKQLTVFKQNNYPNAVECMDFWTWMRKVQEKYIPSSSTSSLWASSSCRIQNLSLTS